MVSAGAVAELTPGAVVGVVLAAGAGRRMGRPKGLVRAADGTPWVVGACAALHEGGCGPVTVVVGAAGDEVAALAPTWARVVHAHDWADGMGASLRVALTELAQPAATTAPLGDDPAVAAMVMLVDTPGVGPAVVKRLLALGPGRATLARAAYDGRPGHPVVLGRDHWAGIAARARGDAGARAYLRERAVTLVECADIGDGRDHDTIENADSADPGRPR